MAGDISAYTPKITQPQSRNAFERERLFQRLDEYSDLARLIWVSAPGGSGKTTFVSSYLKRRKIKSIWYQIDEGDADLPTFFHYMGIAGKKLSPRRKKALPPLSPEYMPGLGAFSRRYFEEISGRLGETGMVVFDNFQILAENAALFKILPIILESLQSGQSIVVISRHQPPASLASIQARQQLLEIGWEALRFNEQEWSATYKKLGGEKISQTNLMQIHQQADGWIAGLVLNLLHGSTEPWELAQYSFDYFATEAFELFDDELQQLLLGVALLPHITEKAAIELCDCPSANKHLARLAREHLFVVKQGVESYILHPLFHDFLRHKLLERYTSQELNRLKIRSAQVLCNTGDPVSALFLYADTERWEELCALLIQLAEALIDSGRYQVLVEMTSALPASFVDNSSYLQLCLGSIAGLHDIDRALAHYRAAAELAGTEDAAISLRAIISAIRHIAQTLQRISELRALLELLVVRLDSISEQDTVSNATVISTLLIGHLISDHDRASINYWLDVAESQLDNVTSNKDIIELANALSFVYCTDSDSHKIEWVIARVEPLLDPEFLSHHVYLLSYLNIMLSWPFARDVAIGKDKLHELFLYGNQNGVVIVNTPYEISRARHLLFLQEYDEFNQLINKLQPQVMPHNTYASFHRTLMAQERLWRGDYDKALTEIDYALDLFGHDGPIGWRNVPLIVRIESLWRLGEIEKCKQAIADLHDQLVNYPANSAIFNLLIIEASIANDHKDQGKARDFMRQAWSRARDNNIIRCITWSPELMLWACQYALSNDIEPLYVTHFIQNNYQFLGRPSYHIRQWPWPVRIYTLGQFQLKPDNGKIHGESKQDRRPLQLLRLLITHTDFLDIDEATEALYPEQDDKKRHSLLNKHLYRLRKLLGNDDIIIRSESALHFNRKLCWIDADAFEALISMKDQNARKYALELYRGEFMPQESGENFNVLIRREHLRGAYLRTVLEHLGDQDGEQALAQCHDVLRIEPLSEVIYQKLMKLYCDSGRHDIARATYEQCRRMLLADLGVEPMAETKNILGLAD